MICPFMSTAQMQCLCRTDCGLFTNGNCAICTIAEVMPKIKSEISKRYSKCVDSVSNPDSLKNR